VPITIARPLGSRRETAGWKKAWSSTRRVESPMPVESNTSALKVSSPAVFAL
jgi:hypothetical protein